MPYIALHYNTLHYTTLHYITLHYITHHTFDRSCFAWIWGFVAGALIEAEARQLDSKQENMPNLAGHACRNADNQPSALSLCDKM